MSNNENKTAGQLMREEFWAKKKKLKASPELLARFKKKEKTSSKEESPNKKVARPSTPEVGA